MLPTEELALRHNPPAGYPHSTVKWRQAIDAYAAGEGMATVQRQCQALHEGGGGEGGEGAGDYLRGVEEGCSWD